MSDQNKIDNIFKVASQSYSASTPSGVWDRLEGSLMATRRKRRFFIWFIFLGFGVITAGGLLYNYSNEFSNSKKLIETSSSESLTISDVNTDTFEQANDPIINRSKVDSSHSEPIKPNSKEKHLAAGKETKITETHTNQNKPNRKKAGFSITEKRNAKLVNPTLTDSYNDKTSTAYKVEGGFQKTNNRNDTISSVTRQEILSVDPLSENDTTIDSTISQHPELTNTIETDSLKNDSTVASTSTPIKPIQKKERKGVFVSIYNGLSINNGVSKGTNETNSLTATSNVTNAGYTMNLGLDVGYKLNNLYASIGVKRYNLAFNGDFVIPAKKINYVQMDQFGNSPLGYYTVSNLDMVIKTKNYSTVDYLRSFNKTQIYIHLLEIPLNVGYSFSYRKIRISPHIGLNMSFILQNEVKISDNSGTELEGEIQNLKSNMFGVSGGLDISYRPNLKFSFGLRTDYTHYLGSINSSSSYNFQPYSFTVSPKLTLWF